MCTVSAGSVRYRLMDLSEAVICRSVKCVNTDCVCVCVCVDECVFTHADLSGLFVCRASSIVLGDMSGCLCVVSDFC